MITAWINSFQTRHKLGISDEICQSYETIFKIKKEKKLSTFHDIGTQIISQLSQFSSEYDRLYSKTLKNSRNVVYRVFSGIAPGPKTSTRLD